MTVDSTREFFELRIFCAVNPLLAWERTTTVLDALRNAGALAPTQFRPRYDRIVPLTPDAIKRHFSRRKVDVLVFSNEQGVSIEWTGYPPRTIPASKLIMRIPFQLIGGTEGADRVLALAKALCTACPPVYGWGHSEQDVKLADDPHATDAFASQGLVQAYWLTILGADMVERIGRAQVASTPAHRIETLDNGSILIVTSPQPDESLSPAAREAQARALAHLRPDLVSDRTLPNLHDRSAKLQPVQPQWDQSLDPFFHLIAGAVPLAERRAKVLELNAYRPLEVTEWRPAASVLPADVSDVADAVDTYHRSAQTFVAGHHDQLPGLMEAEPNVLPQIDAYFLFRDTLHKDPATLQRLMVPTLGAYIGTMIEDQLDGTWVPRRTLEESQIVVGDRAWLPFLRVRNFVQSQQAAIDYSLTRYFYEIRRHAGL